MNAFHPNALVAVIGAGTMGTGTAQMAAQAGHPVLLYDAGPGAAEHSRERVAASYGADRYRVSPLLRRQVATGQRFHT